MEKRTCYVCNKVIQGNPVYICGDKWRHERCSPGSKRWMRSDVGKSSDSRSYYPEDWQGEDDEKDTEE